MDIQVNSIIERLVEPEKSFIQKDREEYGCAMAVVIAPDGIHLDFPNFEDEETKQAAYRHLVQFAKEKNASVIITLNNAWTRNLDDGYNLETIGPGELNVSNAKPCLLITVTGPGIRNYALQMEYTIGADYVEFGELEKLDSTEVYLLPGWSDVDGEASRDAAKEN